MVGTITATIAATAAAFGWMWLVATQVPGGDETGLAYLFFGPAALVVAGVAMLFDRRRRWWAGGLVLGPPIALAIGYVVVLSLIGS